jgi:CubicO group peptidase (beta-lactamase class C family)
MKKLLAIPFLFLLCLPAHAEDESFALIDAWLAAQRQYDRVPGLSAAVVQEGKTTWSAGFGFADLERRAPARADTIYGICSISKLFTGIAVMQLRDAGKLRLDESLNELLPWFELEQAWANSPPITLRSVLTHSAGLPRESDFPYWMGPDFRFPGRDEMIRKLAEQATLYPAERYFQYSNLGLTLAGEIVRERSGQDYDRYVREHILDPLGLADTDTGFPTDARQARVATGYGFPGRSHELRVMPRYDTRAITPAAGFASTALDLAAFGAWQLQALAGETDRVLDGNTLREMQRVQWMDWDWSIARGLAFGVYRIGDRTLSGHAGDCPGFNTRLFVDPEGGTAVSVLANRNRVDVDGYAVAILDILDATVGSEDDTEKTIDLDPYIGSYDLSPWDGEDLVFRWQGGLAIASLPNMNPLDSMTMLRHIEGDRFRTIRNNGDDGHEIRFVRDASGQVTHMNVHSLNVPRIVD